MFGSESGVQSYNAEASFQVPDFSQKKYENAPEKADVDDAALSFEQKEYSNPLENLGNSFVTDDEKANETETVNNENVEQEKEFVSPENFKREVVPTTDGSKRGGSYFVEVDKDGKVREVSNIFLYYDNFKIVNASAGAVYCDVRFNILSNLDTKITQLDMKLVWPKLTTTLSYSNINPNERTYYNYSLLGEGCYELDKAPNIIVNRCRIKGLTASECANKIVWLTK